MRARANNRAEELYHVGQRVLRKNNKRTSGSDPRYFEPGHIREIKDGCFKIELESGGNLIHMILDPTNCISDSRP